MNHGTLIDYRTGDDIRPATRDERVDSLHATLEDGGRGAFETEDGLTCYVECPGVECVDERYTAAGCEHSDHPQQFLSMVHEVWGEDMDLIQRHDGWHGPDGLILVLA